MSSICCDYLHSFALRPNQFGGVGVFEADYFGYGQLHKGFRNRHLHDGNDLYCDLSLLE